MIRILYDISPAAVCEQRGSALTGIPRVADCVFRALIGEAGADVRAVSSLSQAGASRYCRRVANMQPCNAWWQAALSAAFFPTPVLKPFFARMQDRGIVARLVRGLSVQGDKILSPVLGRIPRADLRHSDAYFFPNSYLPRQIQSSRILKAVVLHDMIPVRHPEFFTREQANDFCRGLATLTPETHVFCNSECTRKDFLEGTRHPEAHASVFPLGAGSAFHPGADPRSERYLSSLGLAKKSYFLSVGTLEPRKNMPGILEAFDNFVTSNPDSGIQLVLTGGVGWRLDEAEAAFKRFPHLQARIVRTGFVADEQLQILYEGSIAYISLSHYEGFNLPLIEAMKCGTPVIASDVSSHPEVVGSAGCLVQPGDWIQAGEAMRRISRDAALCRQCSEMGLERSKAYTWEKSVATIMSSLTQRLENAG